MKRFCVIILFVLLSSIHVTAQGIISYGDAIVATLSAEAPVAVYTFQGSQDDQVTVQAIAITPNLDLSITVQSGASILAQANSDPFTQGSSDARVDVRLPSNNVYIVLVASQTGQVGDFLFRLSGQPAVERTVVTGLPAEVPINANAISYYSFTGSPDQATLLNLSSIDTSLQFLAVVRDNNGQIVGTYSGSSALVNVTGVGPYEIALSGVDSAMTGTVRITAASIGEPDEVVDTPTEEPTAPPPLATEEVVDTGGECYASTTGTVNIRLGPSTNNAVVAQMQAGILYYIDAVSGQWYRTEFVDGQFGWVFGEVITLNGDCSGITIVDLSVPTPIIPTATEAVGQATQSPPTVAPTTAGQQATATYTPSYTPTTEVFQPTATFTPSYTPTTPAPQLAPDDARFNNPLNIQLDSTASVLDFVSYPSGDTEDRVRWDIIGMNQNSSLSGGRARLVISVTCFGEGTANIQVFTGGQTYGCGDTIVDQEVTAGSKTGSVTITAVGGTNTYVQWVLTGTATRVN